MPLANTALLLPLVDPSTWQGLCYLKPKKREPDLALASHESRRAARWGTMPASLSATACAWVVSQD